MNARKAFAETIGHLADHASRAVYGPTCEAAEFGHLFFMASQVERDVDAKGASFSEGKLNRWLGYVQGVLVARGIATLDEVKAINLKHRAD